MTLIELIGEGERLGATLRTCKDPAVAKAEYLAWHGRVVEHLEDDPLAVARFNNAQSVPYVLEGMFYGVSGYWQKLQGQLPVLIDLAKERAPKEAVTLRPGAYGMNVDLKVAARKVRDWLRKRR